MKNSPFFKLFSSYEASFEALYLYASKDMIARLSPYMTDHIRRFGEFVLNQDINIKPLEFSLKMKEKF